MRGDGKKEMMTRKRISMGCVGRMSMQVWMRTGGSAKAEIDVVFSAGI
jgi:hypothetical protein